jgi:NAD(P)-dependent dehydrogenase (short-subunit alcohol dehydrogenase family)
VDPTKQQTKTVGVILNKQQEGELMKQIVFITGANRGVGLSLTEKLLESGFIVLAGCRTASDKLTALGKSHAELKIVNLDVTDDRSVSQSLAAVSREVDRLDILINNAAAYLTKSEISLADTDFEDVRKMYEINTLGPLRVTKSFLPLLEQGCKKMIVNISSEAGCITDCWRTSEYGYAMSKTALNMQSKILQNYLKPKGFKILAIHPGWVRTDMGGPDADISPKESAEGIAKLVVKDWALDEGIYFDYRGTPLPW